jgi:hypothetical protein
MTLEGIICSACLRPLPAELWTGVEGQRCPFCGAPVVVKVFPAFSQSKIGSLPQPLAADLEASCFYHTQNRASTPCDECGRFLCSLCTLEIAGRTLCPICFEANLRGRKIQDLESSRTMHDSIALALAIFPAFLFWPILVTAPLTLFWVFRHWNSPRSILPRTRVRFYFAGLIALSQIGFIVVVIAAIFLVRR